MKKETLQESAFQKFLNKIDILFIWLRIFYPRFRGLKNYYLIFFFFPQKVLRINGNCRWPVHFTSRILFTKQIQVGNNSAPGLSNACYIQAKNGIQIGDNVRIGPNVGLISANHDPDDYDKWIKTNPIVIGSNVWIGMGVVIMPGVTIGDNVIIAANAVVNADIPDNSIAGGIPCKIIRHKDSYKGFDYSALK